MRIAICDDELFYVQNIMERIKSYEFHDTKPTIIDGYTNGNELIDAFRIEPYDLVFLDIELDDCHNGTELAKTINNIQANCIFIFITAYLYSFLES